MTGAAGVAFPASLAVAARSPFATDTDRPLIAEGGRRGEAPARWQLPGSQHLRALPTTVAADPAATGIAGVPPMLRSAVAWPAALVAVGIGGTRFGAAAAAAMMAAGHRHGRDDACHQTGG